MVKLCPSCREPLDYPSGDGCAAMTKHKVKPMTDYDETRKASSRIAERFSQALRNLQDDFEDDIVVISLMESYEMVDEDEDEDLLWAIDRVLSFYMKSSDYNLWINERSK
jgi:hypothetical protein